MSRHPSIEEVGKFLKPNPNLPVKQYEIAEHFEVCATQVLNAIPNDSAELTVALRKLLEAKDAAVRASLDL